MGMKVDILSEVKEALANNKPVVALESTIISHGMPYPDNVKTALNAEALIREQGAVPATIAMLSGRVSVGLTADQIEYLGKTEGVVKLSRRDFPYAAANRLDGATTVAGTMIAAHAAGISVFATGGIGGVHRGAEKTMDISADLIEFSRTPVMVVTAGAKAILDLPATMEYLETQGVPVAGFQTDDLPAFYSRFSGVEVPFRVDSPEEAAAMFAQQREFGFSQGMVLANPIPKKDEFPREEVDRYIDQAIREMEEKGIHGKEVTPYLLARIVELTEGKSLSVNIKLYENNILLAAKTAIALCARG
ncbi:MAG: pseudouridine-5'-phosphate glycosidase [Spirochaetia bacterium]